MATELPANAADIIRIAGKTLPGIPLDDMGNLTCEAVVEENDSYVDVRMEIVRTACCLDNLPFNPKRIAERIRHYLSPQTEVGDWVRVYNQPEPVRVVFVNGDDHEFGCETKEGSKCGPYRFGDMMYLWRKE